MLMIHKWNQWVCEQHKKGKYLYTNACCQCCNQVIGLQRAFFLHVRLVMKAIRHQKGELKCSVNKMLKNMTYGIRTFILTLR